MKKSTIKSLIKEVVRRMPENAIPNAVTQQELFGLFQRVEPDIYDPPFQDDLRNFAWVIIKHYGKTPEDAVYAIHKFWNQADEVAKKMVDDVMKKIQSDVKEGYALGSSHGMVGQSDIPPERDQLTDPIYTGKKPFKGGEIKEERAVTTPLDYEFRSFKWLANKDGFNYPVDVKYGTVYLGLLVAKPDGYVIKMVDTPTGKKDVKESPRNKFKSEQLAAAALHKLWQWNRTTKA